MLPEYRQDPITGRWVIIAANRASRPLEFAHPTIRKTMQTCPFCAGHEAETPDASAVFGNQDNWSVRVVPNLYPALTDAPVQSLQATPLQQSRRASGSHEVIVESPKHVRSLTELSVKDVAIAIGAYRHLFLRTAEDPHLIFAMLFKNCGVAAGISLEHVHSQFIATDFVPDAIQAELTGSQNWASNKGNDPCVYCSMICDESAAQQRIVDESEHFLAFCPFASRFPYETWIVPKQHSPDFYRLPKTLDMELARCYRSVLTRIERVSHNVSYNCVFHSAPFDNNSYKHYHWHIEIIPRIATLAGLELGSNLYVNIVTPEKSASLLQRNHVNSNR